MSLELSWRASSEGEILNLNDPKDSTLEADSVEGTVNSSLEDSLKAFFAFFYFTERRW